nr:hypothetical protein [Candidatus Anammoximicrobium sp.]
TTNLGAVARGDKLAGPARGAAATVRVGDGAADPAHEPSQSPTPAPSPTMIYYDTARHLTEAVEHAGQLWLVPHRPGGWAARQRLTLTDEARQERLRPARDIDPGWLGIGSPAAREVSTQTSAVGQT